MDNGKGKRGQGKEIAGDRLFGPNARDQSVPVQRRRRALLVGKILPANCGGTLVTGSSRRQGSRAVEAASQLAQPEPSLLPHDSRSSQPQISTSSKR